MTIVKNAAHLVVAAAAGAVLVTEMVALADALPEVAPAGIALRVAVPVAVVVPAVSAATGQTFFLSSVVHLPMRAVTLAVVLGILQWDERLSTLVPSATAVAAAMKAVLMYLSIATVQSAVPSRTTIMVVGSARVADANIVTAGYSDS
jgi:hypothetical protein